jgi:two-component system response regulator YesN
VETQQEDENLDLNKIADQLNLRPNYIRQLFKQKTGEGIGEYMTKCRMNKAAKLLTKTDMKIQDIANSCGYSSQHYFSASFKKYYGQTPTHYKRTYFKVAE